MAGDFTYADVAPPTGDGAIVAPANGTFTPEQAGLGMPTDAMPHQAATDGPPKTTGYLANIWAGVHEGISTLARISEMQPWRLALEGADEFLGTKVAPPSVSADVVKLPAVTEVEPGSVGEGAARAATRGAVTMLGPAAVGKAIPEAAALTMGSPIRATAVGAVSSVAGAGAREVVPPEWGDVADGVTQLVAGGALLAGEAGLRAGGRLATGTARAVAGPLSTKPAEPIINPETGQPFTAQGPGRSSDPNAAGGAIAAGPGEPIMATPKQQQMAAEQYAARTGRTPAEAAAIIPVGPWGETPPPQVPGVQLTIGQSTGDIAALNAERQARNLPYGREAFTAQEARNDLARVAALENATPADAGHAAAEYVRTTLAAERAAAEADVAGATARRDTAVEGAGVTPSLPGVQEVGTAQREALEAVRVPEKAAAQKVYDAIDPDGTLALDTSPVSLQAKSIREALGKGGKLSPAEADVMEAARDMGGVNKFSDLRSLQSNVSEAMREVRRDPRYGAESQPYRRLSQLMDSIHRSMTEAADRAAQRDVTSGTPVGERFIDRVAEAEGAGRAAAGGAGGQVGAVPAAGGAAGAAGEPGGNVAGIGPGVGPGVHPGDRGVAPPAAAEPPGLTAPRKPESLEDFLISKNGVKPHPEFAENAKDVHHRGAGRLINPNGMTINEARQAMAGERFLTGKAALDEHEVVNKINDMLSGRPVYRAEDEALAAEYEAHRAEASRREHAQGVARSAVLTQEMLEGARLTQGAVDHATDLLVNDPKMHPGEAIRQAMYVDENPALQRNANASALDLRPGVSPLARQAEIALPDGRVLSENFQPSNARDVNAANKQYAGYKQRNRTGVIGEVLATGSGPGGYKLGDAMVPGRLFRAGPAGAEAADALIRQQGGVAQAEAALGDGPALALRNEAIKSGEVTTDALENFRNRYAPALSKFPNIAAKFETVAQAQRSVEAAAAAGQARVRDVQDSAFRFYLGKTEAGVDPQKAIGDLIGSKNPTAEARDLMARIGNNQAAIDGVRRNLFEWLQTRVRAVAEAGTTGEKGLANAAFQRIINNPDAMKVLDIIASPEQRRMVRSLGTDLMDAARAWNAVKIPGSPATAADLHALQGHSSPSLFFQSWLGEKGGEMLAHMLHITSGPLGAVAQAAGIAGSWLLRSRKMAGYETIDQLTTEMMQNPTLGRTLLNQAAVQSPKAPILRSTFHRFMALAAGVGAQASVQR